jgi:TRAP-type C4-dicarboxylate transport system permease small subunit
MNNKYIGITLIIAGIALAIWGYEIYDSAGSQVSRALSGDAPIEAWAGMIGGAVCAAVGIYKIK